MGHIREQIFIGKIRAHWGISGHKYASVKSEQSGGINSKAEVVQVM